jgi:hypothetical protein
MADFELNAVLTAKSEAAKNWLEDLGNTAESNLHIFDGMTNMMNSALSTITKIGFGAVASLTALAFTSPTVSAEFAKMQKPLFEISEELGTALQPGLETFTSLLEGTATWLQENTWFTEGLSAAFSTLVNWLSITGGWFDDIGTKYLKPVIEWAMEIKLGEKLTQLWDMFGPTILGGLIGFKIAGLPGALIGAGLGSLYSVGEAANDFLSSETGQNWQQSQIMGSFTSTNNGMNSNNFQPINVFINGEIVNSDSLEVQLG